MNDEPGTAPVAHTASSRVSSTNGKAIASLVLGIVGLTGIPFVASIIAIVLGYSARREIRERGQEGTSLATAGIILGWVGVVVVVAGIVLVGLLFAINIVSFSGAETIRLRS